MRKSMCFAILLAISLFSLFATASAQSKSQTYRKKLDHLAQMQGYSCAAGYAWFFADGRLNRCSLQKETAIGALTIPVGSIVILSENGKPEFVFLSHDAFVGEAKCMGGGLLGAGEGASTAFYPSGKLEECFLAGDQTVQGVPCANGGIFGGGMGSGALFYESGKLKSCKLTKDLGRLHKGDRFVQGP
jgi:hypothetical protein